jgi:succinate dehydrogenase / fumarate reductase cytochrome b subunit
MTTMTKPPRAYRRGLCMRLAEGYFRYGGGIGQWSWLFHRLTGLGILAYLIAHITDTFFVVVDPAMYDHALALYGGWISGNYYWPIRWGFRLGELGLIACVLFHSINGIRVALVDLWPRAALRQREMFRAVVVVFLGIMIPVVVWVVLPLRHPPEYRPEQPVGVREFSTQAPE